MRWVAFVTLLTACEYREKECMEYDVFVGPSVFESSAVAVGDRFLATWRASEPGVDGSTWTLAMLDGDGQLVPNTEHTGEDYARATLSGPDAAIVERRASYEIRDPEGDVLGVLLDKALVGNPGVFDGDAFVFSTETELRRVTIDGSVSAPIAKPRAMSPAMATQQITWLLASTATDTLDGFRLPRSSTAVDATPRRITDQALFWAAAARDSEAAVVAEGRAGDVVWHVLADDGSITSRVLLLEGVPRPLQIRRLIAEDQGYVVVTAGRLLRVTPDGTLTSVLEWGVPYSNHWAIADGTSRTMHVYDAQVPDGEAPEIWAEPQPDGEDPQPGTLVITTSGTSGRTDCGCAASGASGAPLLVLELLPLVRRRRRQRIDRSRRTSPARA